MHAHMYVIEVETSSINVIENLYKTSVCITATKILLVSGYHYNGNCHVLDRPALIMLV